MMMMGRENSQVEKKTIAWFQLEMVTKTTKIVLHDQTLILLSNKFPNKRRPTTKKKKKFLDQIILIINNNNAIGSRSMSTSINIVNAFWKRYFIHVDKSINNVY